MKHPKTGTNGLLTVAQLAKKYGRDRMATHVLLRNVEPAIADKPKRYDPNDPVVIDLLTNGPGNRTNSVGRELRNTLVEEQTRKLKLANDLKAGKVVPVASVTKAFLQVAGKVQKIVRQRLENEYPTFCAGLQVAEARVYGKRLADEIIKDIAALEGAWNQHE